MNPTTQTIQHNTLTPDYGYNIRARRYTDLSSGRFVTAKEVRKAVDAVIDNAQSSLLDTGQGLKEGRITLAEWQTQTAAHLKHLHLATAVAANGGWANMSAADFGFTGSLIKKQYEYLRQFAQDIFTGKQALNGSFDTRLKLYAQASRGSYQEMERRIMAQAGNNEGRRILGLADHCPGCLDQASKGWQPIEEVAPIGSQQCLTNCRCSIIFRKGDSTNDHA